MSRRPRLASAPPGSDPGLAAAGRSLAGWLSLAAAPTFALMAVLTAILGGGPMPCSAEPMSPLSGMVPMYALMSAFHSPPWIRLIFGR